MYTHTVYRWASLRLLLAPLKWDDYVFQILEFSVHRIREKRGKNSFQFQCGVPVLVPTLVKSYYQLWSLVGQASPNAQTSIHRVSVFVPTSAKLCISNYGPSLDRPVPVSKLVFTECQFWCPPLPSPISSYHSWVQQKLSPLNILISINSHVTFFQI